MGNAGDGCGGKAEGRRSRGAACGGGCAVPSCAEAGWSGGRIFRNRPGGGKLGERERPGRWQGVGRRALPLRVRYRGAHPAGPGGAWRAARSPGKPGLPSRADIGLTGWKTSPHAPPSPSPFHGPAPDGRRGLRAPARLGGPVPFPPHLRSAALARRAIGGLRRHRSAQGREQDQERPVDHSRRRGRGAPADQRAQAQPPPALVAGWEMDRLRVQPRGGLSDLAAAGPGRRGPPAHEPCHRGQPAGLVAHGRQTRLRLRGVCRVLRPTLRRVR